MNEGSNDRSKNENGQQPRGAEIDAALSHNNLSVRKRQLEILVTEEQLAVWDLIAAGRTGKQVAKALGVSEQTVQRRINMALEKVRGWAGRQAEDWRNQQLMILSDQISKIVDDTFIQEKYMTDDDGNVVWLRGKVQWELTPAQAAKIRNMARVTLAKYLQHQANLLDLMVERKEVSIDQKVAIAVYDLGEFDGAASMDDL